MTVSMLDKTEYALSCSYGTLKTIEQIGMVEDAKAKCNN